MARALTLAALEPVLRPQTREALKLLLGPSSEDLGIVRFCLNHLSAEDQALYNAARAKLPEIDSWVSAWL